LSKVASERKDELSTEVGSSYLLDFFAAGGRSVLIRGDPGTGKTSLVLQLLDYHSKNGFKSIYMSTRLSAKTLKSHQPWVEVVQGKYGTVPRLAEDQIGFQDSRRMDGVRAISGLRQYLEQVPNPFVALDSWEGLFFESRTLGVEEISKLVEDYDARFVVVTERREQTDLDYLLDGVIVLRRKFHEGRIVREMELKKLRGVSIRQSRFLFTLDSGKFKYVPPFASKMIERVNVPLAPVSSSKPGIHSLGNEALDRILEGGYRRGTCNVLEISDDVPFEVIAMVLRTIFANFLNNNQRIVYAPFVGSGREQIQAILPSFSKETVAKNVALFGYDGGQTKTDSSLKLDISIDIEQLQAAAERYRRESQKPVLVVLLEDGLEGLYGVAATSNNIARTVSLTKSSGNIGLQLVGTNCALLPELRALCDTNMKLEMIHGTPLIFSIKPRSVLNGIVVGSSTSSIEFVPIV
jgi:KaiC/GvpD/RAD55 family RecA-like ATPase